MSQKEIANFPEFKSMFRIERVDVVVIRRMKWAMVSVTHI